MATLWIQFISWSLFHKLLNSIYKVCMYSWPWYFFKYLTIRVFFKIFGNTYKKFKKKQNKKTPTTNNNPKALKLSCRNQWSRSKHSSQLLESQVKISHPDKTKKCVHFIYLIHYTGWNLELWFSVCYFRVAIWSSIQIFFQTIKLQICLLAGTR